jgi:hypothetical protein
MRLRRRNRRVAPVSKDGAAHGSRRRARRLRNWGRPKIAAPHHEAERDRMCIKLTGICVRPDFTPSSLEREAESEGYPTEPM